MHPHTIASILETPLFISVDRLQVGTMKLLDRDQFMEAAPQYRKRNAWATEPKHGERRQYDESFADSLARRLPEQEALLEAIKTSDLRFIRQWRQERETWD